MRTAAAALAVTTERAWAEGYANAEPGRRFVYAFARRSRKNKELA